MKRWLGRCWRCRRGATAIEYGLIAGLISVAVVVLVSTIGGQAGGMWANINAKVPNVQN